MDGTDADGEMSDEEVLRSGSQTGVSDQEEHTQTTKSEVPSMSQTSKHMTLTTDCLQFDCFGHSGTDPVGSILDRIDAELDAMNRRDPEAFPLCDQVPSSKSHKPGASKSRSSPLGKQHTAFIVNGSADTGVGSCSVHEDDLSDVDRGQLILGSAEIYSEANQTTDGVTDEDVARRYDDNPSDLDSVAAQQIDLKFKEIMRKKNDKFPPPDRSGSRHRKSNSSGQVVSPSPGVRFRTPTPTSAPQGKQQADVPPDLPPHPGRALGAVTSVTSRLRARSSQRASANMLSTGVETPTEAEDRQRAEGRVGPGYGTDNDSVKTEEFETKFIKLMVPTSDSERADKGHVQSSGQQHHPSSSHRKTSRSGNKSVGTPKGPKLSTSLSPDISPERFETQEKVVASTDEEDIVRKLRSIAQTPTQKKTPAPILSRPRSLSPLRKRTDKKVVSIADCDQASRDIAQQSALIQLDMERERRSRSVSPASRTSPPPYPSRHPRAASVSRPGHSPKSKYQQPDHPTPQHHHQTDLSAQINHMFANTSANFSQAEDVLLAGHELKTIRQALLLTKKELREAEADLKHAMELTEDAKSELMVFEFKRGNTRKDFERITEDIRRKQNRLTSLESEVKAKLQEVKNMTAMGLTKEDCIEVKTVKEENICLKTKVRALEGLQLERDELVRQLEMAKDDVMREQKQARLQRAELQEELETVSARLEEAQNSWGDGQVQTARLQAAYKAMEREKNELIQEKSLDYENLKKKQKEETAEANLRLQTEMSQLDKELQELRFRVGDLQSEKGSVDVVNEKLRIQLSDLQSVLAKERQDRHRASNEQKKALHHLKKETAGAVLQLKESMFLEKQKALEDLKTELEQERRESGARSEDRLTHLLEESSQALEDKKTEVSRLQDSLRRLEHSKHLELDKKVNEAVNRERERLNQDSERQLRQEKEASKRRANELTSQLDKEQQVGRGLQKEIADLRKELEEQRRQQREASKEKLVAVARAKDQLKEQNNAEIDRVKFNLQQDHQRDLDRLEEKVRFHEDELVDLRSRQQESSVRERNALQALEYAEKTVISELNEECSRVAGLLGISPRTVHQTSFHLETSDGRISPSFKGRPVLNTALANLRASNEELQNHLAELQQEVESLRTMVETVTKEKEEAIENCRLQMEKQRTLDLEKLKDKLLKEHVEEMSHVIRECAESSHKLSQENHKLADNNSKLANNNDHLQRYGDSALLEALQSKDAELRSLQRSMTQWQSEVEEKFSTQLQLQMAKEREKYQALQHHSTREQKRISDLQKREIDRLEKEVHKLVMFQSNVLDSNRLSSSSSPQPSSSSPSSHKPTPALPAAGTATEKSAQAADSFNHKSQQQLQTRIKQLQADNAALRKQRVVGGSFLDMSFPTLAKPKPVRVMSLRSGTKSPTRDPDVIYQLGERIRQGEKEAKLTEERAKVNGKNMTNKMEEMAKLQNTLLSQNQELHELERAYSNLHQQYNNNTSNRTSFSTPGLNTTI